MAKRKKAKKAAKRKAPAPRRTDVMIRIQPQSYTPVPTTTDLSEPIRDGKSLTIPKTWLSVKQITRLVEKTPAQYVYKRPGKGGKQWDYVTVSYIQRVLDYAFGFNWDFEITEHGKEADHVWVLGRLTVYSEDGSRKIVKSQFGRSEVKYKQGGKELLDYGNDLKAASSDALKKCASMLGIARDIYGKGDYKQESGKEPREDQSREDGERVIQTQSATPAEPINCHGASRGGCPDGAEITPQVRDYSTKVYGKPLCAACQKRATPVKQN